MTTCMYCGRSKADPFGSFMREDGGAICFKCLDRIIHYHHKGSCELCGGALSSLITTQAGHVICEDCSFEMPYDERARNYIMDNPFPPKPVPLRQRLAKWIDEWVNTIIRVVQIKLL